MKTCRLSIFCAFAAAVLIPGLLTAQEASSALTLNQCFELASKKSESLAIQGERIAQSKEKVKQYRGNILPAISYTYLKTYRDTNGGQYTTDLNDAQFTLTQPLFYGLRDFQAFKQAKAQAQTEVFVYESAERDLRSQVAAAFYALVLIDADISNIKNVEKLLADRLAELKERVRLGKSRDSEILMVESQISGFIAQEESALGTRSDAVETLAFLTGLDPSSVSVRDDTFSDNPVAGLDGYLAASKNRSEIKAAESDLSYQKYNLNIAKGAHLPTLNLVGDWYTQRSGTSLTDSDWDALLTLNFPIFQGGSTQAKVGEEASRLKEFEDRLSLARRETESEVRRFYVRAVSSVKQAAAYKIAYEKAAKSYDIQLKDYRYGLVNNLDVLQSLNSMLDVKRSFDRAFLQAKLDNTLLDIAASKQ